MWWKMSSSQNYNQANATLIQRAFQEATTDLLETLVRDGLNIYTRVHFVNLTFDTQEIPIIYAISKKKWKHVLFLLDLHLARPPKSHLDSPIRIFQHLLYLGDRSINDEEGECEAIVKVGLKCDQATLLDGARTLKPRERPEILKSLIAAGADIKQLGLRQVLPCTPECMQIFIEHGIDINYQNIHDGSTAMHYVISVYFHYRGKFAENNLMILLAHGADLTLRDDDGTAPLDNLTPAQRQKFDDLQTKVRVCRQQVKDRIVAFCMAGHRRLGIHSLAHDVPREISEIILGGQVNENKLTLQIAGALP